MDKLDLTKRNCRSCEYRSFCNGKNLFKRIFGCRFWTPSDYNKKHDSKQRRK